MINLDVKPMKTLLLSFLSLCFTAQLYAGGLLVIAANNKAQISEGSTWKSVSIGDEIPEGKFKLADGGYVGLMHPDGIPIELTEAGEYDVKGLLAVNADNESIGEKYLKYVVNDLTDSGEESYLETMELTGSVDRGFFDQYPIKLFAPERSRMLDKKVQLSWEYADAEEFKVTLFNMKEEALKTWSTKGSSFDMDCSKFDIEDGQFFIAQVKDKKGNTSKKIFLQVPEDHEVIHNSRNLIQLLTTKAEKSPIAKIQLAKWMEEQGFLVNSFNILREVNADFEGVPSFEKSLSEFKARHKIY